MPVANVDGIDTYYEIQGSGTPILMCAPGGFDATIDKWRVASAWTGINAIQALAAEHARRFRDGPLAEECEALRVESLLAAGHASEARRAAVAFAKRFPRSVLLPGIVETSHEDPAP